MGMTMKRGSRPVDGPISKHQSSKSAGDIAIENALTQARIAAESASSAANHLKSEILNHRSKFASDATIVQETATLLAHVVQNFDHIYHANRLPRYDRLIPTGKS
jgi:hypothetical protein